MNFIHAEKNITKKRILELLLRGYIFIVSLADDSFSMTVSYAYNKAGNSWWSHNCSKHNPVFCFTQGFEYSKSDHGTVSSLGAICSFAAGISIIKTVDEIYSATRLTPGFGTGYKRTDVSVSDRPGELAYLGGALETEFASRFLVGETYEELIEGEKNENSM